MKTLNSVRRVSGVGREAPLLFRDFEHLHPQPLSRKRARGVNDYIEIIE